MRARAQSPSSARPFRACVRRPRPARRACGAGGRDMRVVEAARCCIARAAATRSRISRRGVAVILGPQFFVRHGGNFDMQIDTVEQRPAQLAQVPLDDRAGAAAFARGVAEEAARAGVQRQNQNEARPGTTASCWCGPGSPCGPPAAGAASPAHCAGTPAVRQKQHAIMRQAHLARTRRARAAANQPRVGHRVMRRPKRPAATAVPRPAAAGRRRCGSGWSPAPPETSAAAGCRRTASPASILPEPGGPIISTLWLPAAATSSARLARRLAANVAEIRYATRQTAPRLAERARMG